MRYIGYGLLVFLFLAPSVQAANTVTQIKNRLNNATAKPEQVLAGLSDKIICKTDKKPICYTEHVLIEERFALTLVTRPEENKHYFILFENTGKTSWKALFSRTLEHMNVPKWKKEKLQIPEPIAIKLIQKAKALL